MKYYILLTVVLFLSGCNFDQEIDVRVNPYLCIGGWQYELSNACIEQFLCDAKTDDYGNQFSCTN